MNSLIKIIEKFKDKKILVLGDVMLDKYIWGNVSRISPEAPVQIVNVVKEEYVPGGASNVAANIAELGAKVWMAGVVGNDETRDKLIKGMAKKRINSNYLISDPEKRTILKVRIFGGKQQLLRFDYEKKGDIHTDTEEKILNAVKEIIKDIDAVIVSDYAKGTITRELMEALKELCKKNSILLIVDPKPEHKEYYKNVTLITPNVSEAKKMAGLSEDDKENVESVGKSLLAELNSNVLVTRGEKGMSLFEKNGKILNIPTYAKQVYNIIGAGDTSVAALTLALVSGANLEESAIIANHAAGITVGKVGTSTVSIEELKESIENA
ncbi:D-glycero-beta-D-manno-heptose-7-phosphate kinase [Candidatus Woesearchaeota archaeon]|nr:D-glycero-beta-D-manno-heptose-7-phosphate kinase [Candidatus Woesearchaeota archaeon]